MQYISDPLRTTAGASRKYSKKQVASQVYHSRYTVYLTMLGNLYITSAIAKHLAKHLFTMPTSVVIN